MPEGLAVNAVNCGSGLAHEGSVPGDMYVGCAGAFAGRPAPTMISDGRRFCIQTLSQESSFYSPETSLRTIPRLLRSIIPSALAENMHHAQHYKSPCP